MKSVQEFYKDKTIFITGGSGFMGKVLIEKLLYSCSDLKQIILLIRSKNGKDEITRVKEFQKHSLFERIMKEKPKVMEKLKVISGEISQTNIGMSDENMQFVIDNTNIIFHVAASINLKASLKHNTLINFIATKKVLEIAKKIKNLTIMVHVSTAFCNAGFSECKELVYDSTCDPLEIIKLVKSEDENSLVAIEKKLLERYPNTYLLTKRLAENLVKEEFDKNLPVCILRPSIVGPTLKEPFVGWEDSPSALTGVPLMVYTEVLRCMRVNLEAKFNFIPVDVAINGFIMAAKYHGCEASRNENVPVYNLTIDEQVVPSYKEFFTVLNSLKHVYPFASSLWYPNIMTTTNKVKYLINTLLFQWFPAIVIDILLTIVRRKRLMIETQSKITSGMKILEYFTLNNWRLKSNKFDDLIKIQSHDDYKRFFIDTKKINFEKYFEDSIITARILHGKDPLSTLSRAKIVFKM
ncbi:hypothetical protein PVAND_006051 [Polypedilum vanderplanki]|uniref:Fatty acyl-CoA reductase n=1 Tax=Polypedilum vanderplanki TaxID=319348 RepID=A0A9J6C2F2_POLVA|nr:hypothetical protein PVAND_006051 [Polypedilum vanderplanki]